MLTKFPQILVIGKIFVDICFLTKTSYPAPAIFSPPLFRRFTDDRISPQHVVNSPLLIICYWQNPTEVPPSSVTVHKSNATECCPRCPILFDCTAHTTCSEFCSNRCIFDLYHVGTLAFPKYVRICINIIAVRPPSSPNYIPLCKLHIVQIPYMMILTCSYPARRPLTLEKAEHRFGGHLANGEHGFVRSRPE